MNHRRRTMSRRDAVKLLVALPAAAAVGCGDSAAGATGGLDASLGDAALGDAAADAAAADAAMADAAADTAADAAADATADAVAADAWATGGTAAMTGAAAYPDPFAGGAAPAVCDLTCVATIGPCHTTSPERRDVSDGWDGLPVRLALRVVDESCEPIEDAIVEIWHTNHRGGYSGDIAAMCNETASDIELGFFRGYQRTDADGRVDFDTCYPGWYNGRAVHIHFRVMTGAYDAADNAANEVISQLFFEDSLNSEIFGAEPIYSDFGQPDTTLGTDNVVGGESDPSKYICAVQRMADGAMMASALIVLRSSSAGACSMQGSGGGGQGGPP